MKILEKSIKTIIIISFTIIFNKIIIVNITLLYIME